MSENNTIQMNKGLSGFVLKLIACISMFIDHAGVVLYETYARVEGIHLGLLYRYDNPYGITYRLLRGIGRLAFPIFCYLLVEGYEHTRNKWKYLGRLVLFAFISEYPFDIAFKGGYMNWNSQNVYFTLAIGLLGIILWDEYQERFSTKPGLVWVLRIATVVGCYYLGGKFLRCDYGGAGVLLIISMYIFKHELFLRDAFFTVILVFMMKNELPALIDLVLLRFYNGKRGYTSRLVKYGFYLFYPFHIVVLLGMRWAIFGF